MAYVWGPSVMVSSGKSVVQGYLGQAMDTHCGDVPCSAQLCLQQHALNAGDFSLFEDFNVGDVIILVNVEDGTETALIEALVGGGCRLPMTHNCTTVW